MRTKSPTIFFKKKENKKLQTYKGIHQKHTENVVYTQLTSDLVCMYFEKTKTVFKQAFVANKVVQKTYIFFLYLNFP